MNALHVTKDFLSNREMDVINKFRKLDDRGKAAIISQIDHEYIQHWQERKLKNEVHRKGNEHRKEHTDPSGADLRSN